MRTRTRMPLMRKKHKSMKPKICFAGTPEFAIPTLEILHARAEVPLVISTPDKPRHRGIVTPTPVKKRAQELGIPVITPENVNAPEIIEALAAYQFDFIVEVAFGILLKPEFLALTPHRILNVHPSLLPKYRGAAPLVWPILDGETETGISIMLVDEGMDTGDVLYQTRLSLEGMTARTLHDRLAADGAEALWEVVENFDSYYARRRPQEGPHTYAKKIDKSMGALDFSESGQQIERKVRGLNPWPGTYFHLQGKRIQVLSLDRLPREGGGEAGVVYRADETGIYIYSADESIRIKKIKPEGKRAMDAADYVRGNPIQVPVSLD